MKRVQINAVIDALALVVFMALASTGLVMRWQLPPGSGEAFGRGMGRRAGERSIELLWGLTRHEWGEYHYWIALGLLAVLSVHLLLHWKWIVCVVRGKQSEASGWRLATGVFAFAALATATALPLVADTSSMTRRQLQHERSEVGIQVPVQEQVGPRDNGK